MQFVFREDTPKKRIVVNPGGGLGDAIVAKPCIEVIQSYAKDYKIDILTAQNPFNLAAIYPEYDIYKADDHFYKEPLNFYDGIFRIDEFISGIMTNYLPNELIDLLGRGVKQMQENKIMVKEMPQISNQFANHAVKLGFNRCSLPLFSMGLAPDQLNLQPKLPKSGLPPVISEPYITIQHGWDASREGAKVPTKGLRTEQWIDLVEEIAALSPIKMVQIGSDRVGANVINVHYNFRGKTSVREAFDILEHALLHIDIEGGMVHAAAALGVKSFVFFGPTNKEFFGYPQNFNYLNYNKFDRIPECNNCWWLSEQWMESCVRKLPRPSCMQFNMKEVAKIIVDLLNKMT